MSRRHRNAHPCPTPLKERYGTEAACLERIVAINAETGNVRAKLPMRAYRCACAGWHMTSRAESYEAIGERMATADAACSPTAPHCIGAARGGPCSCGEVAYAW